MRNRNEAVAPLDTVLAKHRIVICAGSGGVGKTTTAAALAVRAALQGRRTIVLTIDPAKRLANALGMENVGDLSQAAAVDDELPSGMLAAMMLDQKGAWDQMVEHHAPTPDVRDQILSNRFYQHLSQSFAGSQEYMAIEQLCDLYDGGSYDLIVVDTPPTRHALDFLEAPRRLADFLDRSVVKWFVKPYFSASWATMRFVNRTAGFLFRRLEDATGISALVEVSEFFTAMSGLFEGFEPRVRRVEKLLRSRETAFLLVASPEEQVLREAEYFCSRVRELGIPLKGVVFNRVHRDLAATSRLTSEASNVKRVVERAVGKNAMAARLLSNFDNYEILGRGDGLRVEAFRAQLPRTVPAVEVPNFHSDIHSIAGLRTMHSYLFSDDRSVAAGVVQDGTTVP